MSPQIHARSTASACRAEERRFELLCPEGAAVFETAGLPIAHLLPMESRLGVEPSRSGLQPDA